MKKVRITKEREVLEQYRQDFSICGKCKICQACHVQEVHHERFWRNCPSGMRFCYEAYYASGKLELANAIVKGEISPGERASHILYTCMLCGSCEEQCYGVKQMYPLRVIELLRERAVKDGWGPPEAFEGAVKNVKERKNLYGIGDRKSKLADAISDQVKRRTSETLVFFGCNFMAHEELKGEARAILSVLENLGIDYSVLDVEKCCGAPLLELGMRDEFEEIASENIERIESAGIRRIVTPCAHCAYVFSEEYSRFIDLEVLHLTQLISEHLGDLTLKWKGEVSKVAYHDPCMLGRRLEVYKEPRRILELISGLDVIEFERSGKNALCCGGGGMAWWAYPRYSSWVTSERLFEAKWVGAEVIATACPLCQWIFQRTARKNYPEIKVLGIFSLLENAMEAG